MFFDMPLNSSPPTLDAAGFDGKLAVARETSLTDFALQHLGDSNDPNWNNPLRTQPRDAFIPGQFICPHGACFDHEGNIFVVEWVEVGRVTKLRRV